MNKLTHAVVSFAALCIAWTAPAPAGIVITGTRVVYPTAEREVTVNISNTSSSPRMVQAWVDSGDDTQTADTADAPFLLTPPLTRVDGGKGQSLRLMHVGDAYAKDRESVYWLNVLEVPPKAPASARGNHLQFALRTRIKILLRPEGLPGSPVQALDQLRWRVVADGDAYALECDNASAYTVSFNRLRAGLEGQEFDAGTGMVRGLATARFPLAGMKEKPSASLPVTFSAITDYGGSVDRLSTTLP